MRFLPLAALAGLLACAGSTTPDQPAPARAAGGGEVVFEHTFTIPTRERVRVDRAAADVASSSAMAALRGLMENMAISLGSDGRPRTRREPGRSGLGWPVKADGRHRPWAMRTQPRSVPLRRRAAQPAGSTRPTTR